MYFTFLKGYKKLFLHFLKFVASKSVNHSLGDMRELAYVARKKIEVSRVGHSLSMQRVRKSIWLKETALNGIASFFLR